jgi:sec-independent protein translocase protein TatA
MALDGMELIIIVGMVLVLVLWGPNKIPELARALGRAKKEYQKAATEVEQQVNSMGVTNAAVSPPMTYASSDSKLIEVARSLGIVTEGKTSAQIANEIVAVSKTN